MAPPVHVRGGTEDGGSRLVDEANESGQGCGSADPVPGVGEAVEVAPEGRLLVVDGAERVHGADTSLQEKWDDSEPAGVGT